ncbi:hypothetical protein [Kamptonema formosum]|uniref:hypothetical protein n=1 Tax=Kamptonema formosum TaxID=331992 RepID=UPI00037AEE1E|nr:hypothetical protein [Oscillatoria sp. PCC 10802]
MQKWHRLAIGDKTEKQRKLPRLLAATLVLTGNWRTRRQPAAADGEGNSQPQSGTALRATFNRC